MSPAISRLPMNSNKRILTLPGETNKGDIGVLTCDGIMLAILLWNQLYHKMNMLFLIVPLILVAVYLVVFELIPETYCFAEDGLQITHPVRKTIRIAYDEVFNYEASTRDSFMNLLQSNCVKVYYLAGKRKQTALCRPRDPERFVEALRQNCPEFEMQENSKLEVFFDKHEES